LKANKIDCAEPSVLAWLRENIMDDQLSLNEHLWFANGSAQAELAYKGLELILGESLAADLRDSFITDSNWSLDLLDYSGAFASL
jgi:hypothetical protein